MSVEDHRRCRKPVVRRVAKLLVTCWISCLPGRGEFPPSVWDGIYTEKQALRGETVYRQYCASCHGQKLNGGDLGPSLSGIDFISDWDLMSVGDIVDEIQISMPPNGRGQLGEETNALILAYILKSNKFPAGERELPAGADSLRGVVFSGRRFGE